MARRCPVAVALACTLPACVFSHKFYALDPQLPTGEVAEARNRVGATIGSMVLGLPGLDVRVYSGSVELAGWFSPYPLPAVIPFPLERKWSKVTVTLLFDARVEGYIFSTAAVRLRIRRGEAPEAEERLEPLAREGSLPSRPLKGKASLVLEFDAEQPLDRPATLELGDGLRLRGQPVPLPPIGLWPHYELRGGSM